MATDLARMVPGFDFLQGLMKNAGAAMPGMGQWIAPTLDPKELDKRIQELKTVQFWLEQNARLLATTIQALEVQRMTLSTLQTMNLPMTDLRDALKIGMPQAAAPAPDAAPAPQPLREQARKGAAASKDRGDGSDDPNATAALAAPAGPPAAGAIDPLQWWGALTQQFTELAGKALQDTAGRQAGGPAPAARAKTATKAAAPAAAPRKRRR